ncbi:TIGR03915 family putative DNA repair protein [Anaerovorax odorimutans]|uniref:TIGR03915 family putative DNA repair protein n=1 Tax=Anaerovorax odorimutans TaxID=109327 RepID=UPI0004128C6F|nr:TIGR03915 family putative DNA repair protein [Anaerovorax odorimutans]
MDYLYDGTFEGFLTCVYYHYYNERAAGIFTKDKYQMTLLGDYKEIKTEEDKAVKVYNAIKQKISNYDLKRIYKVFLSTVENKENKMLEYIVLGFKLGPKVSSLHGNATVFAVQDAEKKVGFEVHRLTGLLRFSVMVSQSGQEILYCEVEPDHDVLELLSSHFTDRFKHDPFIIHDKRRNKALIANEGKWYISDFSQDDVLDYSLEEREYRELWSKYFETIAIKERINPKCQKRCMPVRYWKNLTEFLYN